MAVINLLLHQALIPAHIKSKKLLHVGGNRRIRLIHPSCEGLASEGAGRTLAGEQGAGTQHLAEQLAVD